MGHDSLQLDRNDRRLLFIPPPRPGFESEDLDFRDDEGMATRLENHDYEAIERLSHRLGYGRCDSSCRYGYAARTRGSSAQRGS